MNTRFFAVLLVVALAAGCTAATEPSRPIQPSASSSPRTVEPLPLLLPVGERGSEEGWVGDDELLEDDIAVAGVVYGHPDDPPATQELEAAVTTASQVLEGWLTADQTQRRDTLGGVAAEALIDAFDDPRFTPAAENQLGPTHVVAADLMEIITRHRLDTGDVVDLTLSPEPDAPHGWIVIAIIGH